MKVLLINPDSPFLIDARTFPPLGLLYLGAALEERIGAEVVIADLAFNDEIDGHDPDLIGIMCLTAHYPNLKKLVAALRILYPKVPVVVGGPHFSTCPDDYREVGADAVCMGDGEEVITHMALFIKHRTTDSGSGRVAAAFHGKWNSDRWIVDVDEFPIPARHLVDIHRYKYTLNGIPTTTAMTQRGCPYECTFCCHWEGYRKVRMRATENVIEEIRRIKEMGFGGVMYYDDEFNLVNKRVVAMCNEIEKENIIWRAFIKANLFNEEQAEAFARSGCYELCTGVESGSDEILKTIQKKATVAQNTRSRELCREFGIRFKAFAMIGHPGETEETAQMTKQWLIDNKPDAFSLSVYMPYIGTPVTDKPWEYDIEFDMSYDFNPHFYMGRPGEYQENARTSALSAKRITELRDEIQEEVCVALGLPPPGTMPSDTPIKDFIKKTGLGEEEVKKFRKNMWSTPRPRDV